MTGTAGQHELKFWSTQSWACLQTVTLLVPPTSVSSPGGTATAHDSYLQVGIDLTASYLVLCDIARKVHFHLTAVDIIQVNYLLTDRLIDWWYGDYVSNAIEEKSSYSECTSCRGMWALKLCFLYFLTDTRKMHRILLKVDGSQLSFVLGGLNLLH